MRRRDFVIVIASSSASWPLAARARQGERMRRIATLNSLAADNPEAQARHTAFLQRLQELGWSDSRNVQIDARWGEGNADRIREYATELAAMEPDSILATGAVTLGPLLRVTRIVPIVFVVVPDPVGAGFIKSLARPGGNATGFLLFEYSVSAKWLELLREIAPRLTRVAVIRDSDNTAGTGQWGAIQSVAPSFGVELSPVSTHSAGEMERDIAAFAEAPNGGLIVTASALAAANRDHIIALAARHKLPAIYYERNFAAAGGLISYGPDFIDQYRRGASYIDRILKGEKPAELPVQAPTKYELSINLTTAKALNLAIPPTLLGRADTLFD